MVDGSSKVLSGTEVLEVDTQARSVTHHISSHRRVAEIARQLLDTRASNAKAYSALSEYHVVIDGNEANGAPLLFSEIRRLASEGITFDYRFAE